MTDSGYSTWTATDKAIKAAARAISEEQGRDFHTVGRGFDPTGPTVCPGQTGQESRQFEWLELPIVV